MTMTMRIGHVLSIVIMLAFWGLLHFMLIDPQHATRDELTRSIFILFAAALVIFWPMMSSMAQLTGGRFNAGYYYRRIFRQLLSLDGIMMLLAVPAIAMILVQVRNFVH